MIGHGLAQGQVSRQALTSPRGPTRAAARLRGVPFHLPDETRVRHRHAPRRLHRAGCAPCASPGDGGPSRGDVLRAGRDHARSFSDARRMKIALAVAVMAYSALLIETVLIAIRAAMEQMGLTRVPVTVVIFSSFPARPGPSPAPREASAHAGRPGCARPTREVCPEGAEQPRAHCFGRVSRRRIVHHLATTVMVPNGPQSPTRPATAQADRKEVRRRCNPKRRAG